MFAENNCLSCGYKWKNLRLVCSQCKSKAFINNQELKYECFFSRRMIAFALLVPLCASLIWNSFFAILILILMNVVYFHNIVPHEKNRKKQFVLDLFTTICKRDCKSIHLLKQETVFWPLNTPAFIPKKMAKFRVILNENACQQTFRKSISKIKRQKIWRNTYGDKTDAKCCICLYNSVSVFSFQCGHIVALAKGGTDELSNFKAVCQACNLSMGTENMNEFRKKLWQ